MRRSITERVRCPFCGADIDETCLTPRGLPVVTGAHRARVDNYRSKIRNSLSVWKLLNHDTRFQLSKDDLLVGLPYQHDPGSKLTVIARISDGFDPMCNQYFGDIEFVRWATPDEVNTYLR